MQGYNTEVEINEKLSKWKEDFLQYVVSQWINGTSLKPQLPQANAKMILYIVSYFVLCFEWFWNIRICQIVEKSIIAKEYTIDILKTALQSSKSCGIYFMLYHRSNVGFLKYSNFFAALSQSFRRHQYIVTMFHYLIFDCIGLLFPWQILVQKKMNNWLYWYRKCYIVLWLL